MKKLYNSDDLKREENTTPHFHFTCAGIIVPSIIAIVVLGGIFLLTKFSP